MDSEQWHLLWDDLDTNLVTRNQVLADFIENESLYTELMDEDERLAGSFGTRDLQVAEATKANDDLVQLQSIDRTKLTKESAVIKKKAVSTVVRPEDLKAIKS